MEKWLKVRDVAEALSMSQKTIHKLIKDGQLPGKRIGHHWRIPESGLAEFLNKQ